MNKFERFDQAQQKINKLDRDGFELNSEEMLQEFKNRNSFGLDPDTKVHRIFQQDHYDHDVANGYLTLPLAAADVWSDELENPFRNVQGVDSVTGRTIEYGSLVSSFYALCWTDRALAEPSDWVEFSHGRKAVRISTTVGKIMDRMMRLNDKGYMHRSWLVNVEYKEPTEIKAMKTSSTVLNHMESTGAMLATSATVVRTDYSHENEVRMLMDDSIKPSIPGLRYSNNKQLVHIPFDWTGFSDNIEYSK